MYYFWQQKLNGKWRTVRESCSLWEIVRMYQDNGLAAYRIIDEDQKVYTPRLTQLECYKIMAQHIADHEFDGAVTLKVEIKN